MRPAALMRGPMRKPMSVAVKPRFAGSSCATSSNARRPTFTGRRRPCDAERGDDAVFTEQRHCVCDGCDHQHLQERGQQLFAGTLRIYPRRSIWGFEQRLGQLECDARAAEVLARVGAVRLVGVEDGERLGQSHRRFGQVVVGDDEVEVEARGFIRGGEGADAGVHTDDEAHVLGRGAGEHLGLHAIAVAQAMRDVIADGATEDFDGRLEQDDRSGAVDVVVAVDEDRLARGDGLLDARDRCCHAVQGVGIEQVIERGMKELRGRSGIGDAALEQQGSDRYGNARCIRESFHGGRVWRWKPPVREGRGLDRRPGRRRGSGAHAGCLTRRPRPRR